jgi:putative transposase
VNLLLTHRIALDANEVQRTYFAKAAGTARCAWNWALGDWQRQYAAGEKPNKAALRRQLNVIKREQFPRILEVSKTAPQQAFKNLGAAFKPFFDHMAKYPRFKKKGTHDRLRADNGADTVTFDGKHICLPVISWVKMCEPLRFGGKIKSVAVSRVPDRWFASACVAIEHDEPVRENQAGVGVDLGVSAARLHKRISDIRQDALHKLTTNVCRRFSAIGIKDLNVKGMLRNGNLAALLRISAGLRSVGSSNTRLRCGAASSALPAAGIRRARLARHADASRTDAAGGAAVAV